MAQATYAQDTRQLLHFRRTLVSFRSRFCAGLGILRLDDGSVQKTPQNTEQKTIIIQWAFLGIMLVQLTTAFGTQL